MTRTGALFLWACVACSSSETPESASAAFPSDYEASYVEVRGCRKSADHELDFVRVLADQAALAPYTKRSGDFPEGAVVLKEQYDPADPDCTGPISQWTVMRKNTQAKDHLGWDWQRVAANRHVTEVDTPSCYGCHADCTGRTGYDFTCEDP